jgi:cytochrome c peroxidase
VFGDGIFANPQAAFDRALFALERYQVEDDDFAPFSSKFDAYLRYRAALTPQEMNGLALFERADKGNCAACHPSTTQGNTPAPLFTDFSYDNLGIPRNGAIPANADAAYRDGGLCESPRDGMAARTDLCGAFKVPSLRNVALRRHLFHNGRFDQLEDAIRFYVRRDTDPGMWYRTDALGNVTPYDDVRPSERANVNTAEAPYDRRPGDAPALTESEIGDIAAFLRTLTDGYVARE